MAGGIADSGTDAATERVARRYVELLTEAFPVRASALGVSDAGDRLGDPGASAIEAYRRTAAALRREIDPARSIDGAALAGMLDAETVELGELDRYGRDPAAAIDTALAGVLLPVLRAGGASVTPAVQANLESRLREIPSYLDAARRSWHDVPATWAAVAAESARSGASFLRNDLAAAFATHEESRAVNLAVTAAGALDATAAHLATIPRTADAWRAGEPAVARLLASGHGLADTPSQIASRGERMVADVLAEMAAIDPGWRDTVERGKADHPAAGDLLDAYRRESRRIHDLVAELDLAPAAGAPVQIVATPAYLAPTTPYAAYEPPGPFDAEQPGYFYVTVPEAGDPFAAERLRGHSRHAITLTAVHEAYPGHHLQLDVANRAGLTRALVGSALTIEGWAFYCEGLMGEHGAYGMDPAARLFQLKDQLWRAVRVVVDMALHCADMSEADAVAMLVDVAGLETENAVDEVRRYTSTPTYQVSYAIGAQEIIRLRDATRQRDGASFTLGGFHAELLGYGSIPVPLTSRQMLGAGVVGDCSEAHEGVQGRGSGTLS